jgi:hypothetical protein
VIDRDVERRSAGLKLALKYCADVFNSPIRFYLSQMTPKNEQVLIPSLFHYLFVGMTLSRWCPSAIDGSSLFSQFPQRYSRTVTNAVKIPP